MKTAAAEPTRFLWRTKMLKTEKSSAILRDRINGCEFNSIVADNEPVSQRQKAMADLATALPGADVFDEVRGSIDAVATTPDFHSGKPVPVGVIVDTHGLVMPHFAGSDIGCGMHMVVLSGVREEELTTALEGHLRHVHFQGGRNIALTGRQRHAVLREGLPGLAEALKTNAKGLLQQVDMSSMWRDIDHTCDLGYFETTNIDPAFEGYANANDDHSYDAILGTIGGGNHFVEFGVADQIVDGSFANVAGLKKGDVVLVVHSGSLDFGQAVYSTVRDGQKNYSVCSDRRILTQEGHKPLLDRYLNGLANATNVAFVNRYLIAMASIEALSRTVGRSIGHSLVYDAPHNVIWSDGEKFRHRKGACPARGPGELIGSAYHWLGEPVILPGSMGDGTWLLKGLGSEASLQSSAHGAGRRLSRQEARAQTFRPEELRIVGPVDPSDQRLKGRGDILREIDARLKEEAPAAYRSIDDVVEPMEKAGLVSKVARIRPVLTVKA